MTNKFFFVFLLLASWIYKLDAQTFYVSAPINSNFFGSGSDIYKVTITPSGLESTKLASCSPGDSYFSIAMNKKNFFWLRGSDIYVADVAESAIENCRKLFSSKAYSNALTLGYDGKLYYYSGFLFATDIESGKTDILGYANYAPTGDLCFYNKDLYMAAYQGIVKINREEPNKSTLHIPLSGLTLFGIVSVPTSLHKNTVYGFAYINSNQTDVIEFDIENQKVVGVIGSLPYSVLDAASIVEDGSIIGIDVENIEINQDCSTGTSAVVDVITKPHVEDFVYTLNGVSNSTGKFGNVPAGKYTLSINSASDSYTTTIDVPEFSLIKPVYSWTIKNQICETGGEITFSTSAENSAYQMRYNGELFPLNNTFSNLLANQTNHFEVLNKYGCKVDEQDITVGRDKCKIQLEKIEVQQQCNVFHRGVITVLTKTHAAVYTYTLNTGESNSTGLFENLLPGNYIIKIISDEDEMEISAVVPDYKLSQEQYSWEVTNQVCEVPGSISFSGIENSAYQVKYKENIFPISHTFSNLTSGDGPYYFEILNKDGCKIDNETIAVGVDKCHIKFDKIEVHQQCDVFHRGVITMFTGAHAEPYTYTLNTGEYNSTGIFKNLVPGSYSVKITSAEDEFETSAIVPDYRALQPEFTFVKTNPACAAKGIIQFNNISGNSYQIKYENDLFPLNHVFTDMKEGSHHFIVLNEAACLIDEFNVELVYEPCPIVISSIDIEPECDVLGKGIIKIICPPIPESYSYTLNDTETNSTGAFGMLSPGTYEVEVKASGGAPSAFSTIVVPDYSLTKPFTIVNSKNPVCDLTGEISFNIDDNSDSYNIRYNSAVYPSDYVFTGLYAGSYTFAILKSNGCIVDELDVALETEACNDVSFPNAFTPNSDNINDTFKAKEGSRAFNFEMRIFDRRGVMVFSSNKLYNAWDGNCKNGAAPVATYFWIATFTTQENKKIIKKGSVTLMR